MIVCRELARTPPAFADSSPTVFSRELWQKLGEHLANTWRTLANAGGVCQKYLRLGLIRAKVRVRVSVMIRVRVRVIGVGLTQTLTITITLTPTITLTLVS